MDAYSYSHIRKSILEDKGKQWMQSSQQQCSDHIKKNSRTSEANAALMWKLCLHKCLVCKLKSQSLIILKINTIYDAYLIYLLSVLTFI